MSLTLTYVTHEVHRRSGPARASAELLTRLARDVRIAVAARRVELASAGVEVLPVRSLALPRPYGAMLFARAAAQAERRSGAAIVESVGAAILDADVITAQACRAAVGRRYAGFRGTSGLERVWRAALEPRLVSMERRAFASARLRRVIAVSRGVAREITEHYGVPASVVTVIPNGVDRATFRPGDGAERVALRAALGLPRDACLALFVGNDWARKGLRDAIAAVAGLPDVELVVLGAGDREGMIAHARARGAEGQVRFAGEVADPERWYRAADMLLLPSRYEGFSLASLEAAASGVPVIAHVVNGTEDLITDGVNGFLAPWGSEALRERVVRLRDDSALRERMRIAAVASTVAHDWDRVAAAHLQLLREVG